MEKLFFPYDLLRTPEDLDALGFPAYDSFYSRLRKGNVLEDGKGIEEGKKNYAELRKIWDEEGMTRLSDLLRRYCIADVKPFYHSVKQMISLYQSLGINMLQFVSLPSVSNAACAGCLLPARQHGSRQAVQAKLIFYKKAKSRD